MPEYRTHHIAGCPLRILALSPNPCGRVGLQLAHGDLHRFIMRLNDPFIIANQSGNRNRFGW
jgi:hypothetical protein